MPKYRCKNCGYDGKELIFQFNEYGYCIASNEREPEHINCELPDWPDWVEGTGDAEIGEPVGCPKCHTWGVDNFGIIE